MTVHATKIMLVEDDSIDVAVVEKAIRKLDSLILLDVQTDADSALGRLQRQANLNQLPNVVLLDINLPGMNGHEMLAKIRENKQLAHLVVFMISTSFRDHDRNVGYSQKMAGYIFKDSEEHMEQSLNMVLNFLENRNDFSPLDGTGLLTARV